MSGPILGNRPGSCKANEKTPPIATCEGFESAGPEQRRGQIGFYIRWNPCRCQRLFAWYVSILWLASRYNRIGSRNLNHPCQTIQIDKPRRTDPWYYGGLIFVAAKDFFAWIEIQTKPASFQCQLRQSH